MQKRTLTFLEQLYAKTHLTTFEKQQTKKTKYNPKLSLINLKLTLIFTNLQKNIFKNKNILWQIKNF